MRVIIVGAGVGGLGTAIALDRVGIDSIVLEKSSSLSAEGAAITLWNNGLQALARLRLRTDYARVVQPLDALRVVSFDGRPLGVIPVARLANGFGPGAAMVYRPELATLLGESVRPEQLSFSSEVVDVAEGPNDIAAVLADGRRIRGDLLVGADGARGLTKRLFAPSDAVYCKHVAWRGTTHFAHPFFPPGASFSVIGRGAYFVVHHLTGGRFYWIGTRRADTPLYIDPARRKVEASDWFSSWIEPVRALIDATPEKSILVNDIYSCGRPDFAVRGRSLLIGDAAHLSAPQLGQGAALALEDAVTLADCLRAEGSAGALRFARIRQARVERVLAKSRAVADSYHLNSAAQVWVRNSLIQLSPPAVLLQRAGWAARTILPTLVAD